MARKVEAELADDLYEQLVEYADARGIPLAGAIAQCVAQCLDKTLDAFDLGDGSEQQGGLA